MGAWVRIAAAVVAAAMVTPPTTTPAVQGGVGPTGTMFNGNNTALTIPDDGSLRPAAAASTPAASGQRIGGQEAGQSDTSSAGGGN